MKFLNVAEKNDAAKNIAAHLSRGSAQRVSTCAIIKPPPLAQYLNVFLYLHSLKAYQNTIKSINSNRTFLAIKMQT